ncbi:MAG: type II toxin-antitoxin system VapC family toxin [Geminicoccaceae bacterium]
MRLLLDTQIAIWMLNDRSRVPRHIVDLIGDPANRVFVSAVSIWEISIKFPLGKATAPPFSGEEAIRHFTRASFSLLPVTPEHAAAVGTLPHHHGDPFDRLLIAQALTEPLRFVTADRRLAAYSDTIIQC